MTFFESCQYVGRELPPRTSRLSGPKAPLSKHKAQEPKTPSKIWQDKAQKFIKEAIYHLWSPYGQPWLKWLMEDRGLREKTIRDYSLGYMPKDRFEEYEAWGFDSEYKEDGKRKKIWLPESHVIPFYSGDKIIRVKFRRHSSAGEPRYFALKGSDSRSRLINQSSSIFVIVENEIDGLLLAQEGGDLGLGVVALGSASIQPDSKTTEILHKSQLILLALDFDPAGRKAAWNWWRHHFTQAERWPPIDGKDPGEMLTAGVNLRDWIKAGIEEHSKEVATTVGEEIEAPTPSQKDGFTVVHETSHNSSSTENVPKKGEDEQVTPEHAPTCYECGHFRPAVNSPNPGQALGYCEQKRKSRFGVARACEAILEPYPGVKN